MIKNIKLLSKKAWVDSLLESCDASERRVEPEQSSGLDDGPSGRCGHLHFSRQVCQLPEESGSQAEQRLRLFLGTVANVVGEPGPDLLVCSQQEPRHERDEGLVVCGCRQRQGDCQGGEAGHLDTPVPHRQQLSGVHLTEHRQGSDPGAARQFIVLSKGKTFHFFGLEIFLRF